MTSCASWNALRRCRYVRRPQPRRPQGHWMAMGACGWRQCGAQADAAQSLCKLRANLGMVVTRSSPYLDVAKRSLDEVLQIGVSRASACVSAACCQLPAKRRCS